MCKKKNPLDKKFIVCWQVKGKRSGNPEAFACKWFRFSPILFLMEIPQLYYFYSLAGILNTWIR
jgi:hypothetical protein